ncbi:condensation domain-containing protein [Duganella sp. Root1480D1]|uniref:condensation domain-containing protein n=1 Tax=Duganella sp. Root1480D1 TaxID=1736471 RepID=UPI00070E22DC|nr:condensation domain-containing protein [Duganella sp. Root1480D1]KQZ29258.1 hypothetical protein ASD58_30180 [Duganella sp. Root1480D1]
MSLDVVLRLIAEQGIALHLDNEDLVLRAGQGKLDGQAIALLKQHKSELVALLKEGALPQAAAATAPRIVPEMLPLVELSQAEIDRIVAGVPGGAANVQDIYPLAPLQEGILFHYLLGGQGDPYLVRKVISFSSRELLDSFLAALQTVIDRHDVLRSAVVSTGVHKPVQVVHRRATLPVTEAKLAGGIADLLAHTDPLTRRMDLSCAPLLEAHIAEDADAGNWVLVLLNHHIMFDHVTLDIVVGEIRAILQGQQAHLPKPLPYRNFIARVLAMPREEHEAYFKRTLGDIEQATTPFGMRDLLDDRAQMDEAVLPVPAATATRLRDSARKLGVSRASAFHVAWAMVLAACGDSADVVFGTVLSGRTHGTASADRMLGLFVNTLPVRVALGAGRARQVVLAANASLTELLMHEQASLAMAQRCSGVPASQPLFTALLNYRHSAKGAADASDAPSALGGVQILAVQERSNYPFGMAVDDFGDGFSVRAQCDGVAAARIAGMMVRAVEQLAEALDSDEDGQLDDCELLPPAERQQLLHDFNATARAYPGESLVHAEFARLATAQPQAPALIGEQGSVSYGELNARANRLAHYLRALGIGPDARVGLCLERGADMIVAMLAVLKAGGAYVPLDAGYPAERLAFMLADIQRGMRTKALW